MSARVRHATLAGLGRATVLIALWALLGLAAIAAVETAPARADTTIHVTTTADAMAADGQCSLVEALLIKAGFNEPDCSALPVSGTATIVVPAGCYRISAAVPFPELSGTEVIEGAGPGPADCSGGGTVIQQQAPTQVLFIDGGANTTISGLTLTGGHPVCASAADPFCNGGGVFNAGRALALRDVLVTGNSAGSALDAFTGGRGGGGLYNFKGSAVTIEDSTITANSAGNGAPSGSAARGGNGGEGGGILNDGGQITLVDSTVSGNSAGAAADGGDFTSAGNGTDGGYGGGGGGIANSPASTLAIERSTISGNHAGNGGAGGEGNTGGDGAGGGSGGAILNLGQLSVSVSTISANAAGAGGSGGLGDTASGGSGGFGGSGGGVWTSGNPVVMTNATVSGNATGTGGLGGDGAPNGTDLPGGVGGGIDTEGDATLRNATVANNAAARAGGIFAEGGNMSETGSVIAANRPYNCGGTFLDDGHNLTFGDATCPGPEADPKLGPLRANGGPTQTIALGAGSAAVDLIPPASGCPPTDQRGVARPHGAGCDAGAYELAPPLISGASATATSPTTATIKAGVNPNLQDTTVVVDYGTTTAYGPTSTSEDIGAGNTPGPLGVQLSGLAPGVTYHAQLVVMNADGASRSADLVFTTPANRNLKPVAPSLSQIRQSSRRWVEGNKRASISARHRLPVGTKFSFELNETATVNFVFTQRLAGRTVERHCVARTRRDAHNPRCTMSVIGGALAFSAHAGVDKVQFDGRLPRHHKLRPGTYRLVIVATDTAGRRSAPARLTFTILRRLA